jgi:3alpha(or 20beta)-hydroxysteroid dehydrogenase
VPSAIVNISSIAGLRAFAGFAAYATTKWAVRGLTKSAAIELGPRGVRVNSVHPGTINTSMAQDYHLEFDHVPLGRAGEPGEISNLVVFLASDESSFSTGSEFIADGGEHAGEPVAVGRRDADEATA